MFRVVLIVQTLSEDSCYFLINQKGFPDHLIEESYLDKTYEVAENLFLSTFGYVPYPFHILIKTLINNDTIVYYTNIPPLTKVKGNNEWIDYKILKEKFPEEFKLAYKVFAE